LAGFASILRTYDSIVIIADKEKSYNQSTGIIKIKKNSVAVVFRNLDGTKKFCNDWVKDISDEDDIAKICKTAINAFEANKVEYQELDFSMVIASFVNPRRTVFYGFWFDEEGAHHEDLPDRHFFSKTHEDLAQYLVNKVYSEHMLVDELSKLSSFVTLQCIKIFSIGVDFDFVTLSNKGIKWLTDGEVKDQLFAQEKIDHKLIKSFSGFFLDEVQSN